MLTKPASTSASSRELLDVLIRFGLLVALVVFCYRIFHPFLNLMLWSVILAVTLYPLHRRLRSKLGNRDGRTASLIVVLGIALLIVPVYLIGSSIAQSAEGTLHSVKDGTFHIPPPKDSIANVPVIGKKLHAGWSQASTDLTGLAKKFGPQLKEGSIALLGKLAGLGLGLLVFVFALILAGIFMAFGEAGANSADRINSRFFGPDRGPGVTRLCAATIRAVAQGVVGIAFIQMVLIGIGFALMGVPAAGLLSLLVLLFGIMQLPATIITVPVIAYVLATKGVDLWTLVFSVYVFVAGLADNVLKPLLLGRGVEVPMPVVLIGALGGMVTGGIIGLFIGPVVLAVFYQLFWQWVDMGPPGATVVDPAHPGVVAVAGADAIADPARPSLPSAS